MAYNLDTRLLLDRIIEAYKFKNDAELARHLDVLPSRISNWVSRNSIDFQLVFTRCEELNFDWLLRGEGNIYRTTNVIQGDRNIGNNNTGTIGGNVGDHSINIAAPGSGTQKIIYPNRTIEIAQSTQEHFSGVAEQQAQYLTLNEIIANQKEEISSQRAEIIRLQQKLIDRLESDK